MSHRRPPAVDGDSPEAIVLGISALLPITIRGKYWSGLVAGDNSSSTVRKAPDYRSPSQLPLSLAHFVIFEFSGWGFVGRTNVSYKFQNTVQYAGALS